MLRQERSPEQCLGRSLGVCIKMISCFFVVIQCLSSFTQIAVSISQQKIGSLLNLLRIGAEIFKIFYSFFILVQFNITATCIKICKVAFGCSAIAICNFNKAGMGTVAV